jgi:hypothetical protein
MTSCNENDNCFAHCGCEFYNEETDEYNEICIYNKTNCYCSSNCCNHIECRNYTFCNEKLQKMVTFYHNDICMKCEVQMGRHIFTNKIEECCVCLENKLMIILQCKHNVCNDCWYNITKEEFEKNNDPKPLCPLCRNLND